jgi:hypothetical protein
MYSLSKNMECDRIVSERMKRWLRAKNRGVGAPSRLHILDYILRKIRNKIYKMYKINYMLCIF